MEPFKIPESIRKLIETQNKFVKSIPKFNIPPYNFPKIDVPEFSIRFNSELLESLKKVGKIVENLKNNPELQFAFITDLEILNLKSSEEFKESLIINLKDEDINAKEEILTENLVPFLEELGIENLWFGASRSIEDAENPDRLRHCLISLRTLLEYMIDSKLAPIEKLKDAEMFEKKIPQIS